MQFDDKEIKSKNKIQSNRDRYFEEDEGERHVNIIWQLKVKENSKDVEFSDWVYYN